MLSSSRSIQGADTRFMATMIREAPVFRAERSREAEPVGRQHKEGRAELGVSLRLIGKNDGHVVIAHSNRCVSLFGRLSFVDFDRTKNQSPPTIAQKIPDNAGQARLSIRLRR